MEQLVNLFLTPVIISACIIARDNDDRTAIYKSNFPLEYYEQTGILIVPEQTTHFLSQLSRIILISVTNYLCTFYDSSF